MASYGSGAGSDGFDFTVTDHIKNLKIKNAPLVAEMVSDKNYVDYGTYAKYTDLLYWE
jgi:3-hydroxy-3-methylglutaryl CoA synthase